jgi:hypothetical protein
VDYTLFKLKSIIQEKPALRNDPMVKAALEGNFGKLLEGPHHNGLLHVLVLTHTDMTIEEFSDSVEKWFDSSQHPRFKRPFSQVTYQPMQEVLIHPMEAVVVGTMIIAIPYVITRGLVNRVIMYRKNG